MVEFTRVLGARTRDCRWVGWEGREGTQVRRKEEIGGSFLLEKDKEGVGGEGAGEAQESIRDRTCSATTTRSSLR